MSEPTDLIREATDALDDELLFNDEMYVDGLVRRLRDALVDERAVKARREGIFITTVCERDEARAALAEANTTIERVEARIARLREDYASELAATDPDTNWALGVKHAVQLIARELRRERS